MDKLLFLSVIMAAVFFPIVFAYDDDVRRGIKRTVVAVAAFNLVYLFAILYVYPRLAS